MANARRFLVTGAAGFVGANLCRRLVARGEEVHVILKATTRPWRLDDIQSRLHAHQADLTDAAAVDRVIEEVRPSVIYHLATHGAYHYQGDAEQILKINVLGLWNLLRACNRVDYELFVNTGSSSEYGAKPFAMRETDVLDPNSFYAVAKSAQSLLCQHMGRTSDRTIVTLRLFSVYGPYEEPKRLIPNLMAAALGGRAIEMVSPETVRDFVYVDDAVDAYLEIDRLKQISGEILNVGTGAQTTLMQLVATMGAVHGRSIQAQWGKMAPRAWDSSIWVADVSKLRRLLGSVPRTNLEQGLSRTLAWFREHQHFYRDPS
jgi:nucleoside-diphosphate-sugar epimerase